jgi:hypothetical protein
MNVSSDALNTKENNDEHTGNDTDGDPEPEEGKSQQEIEGDKDREREEDHEGNQGEGHSPFRQQAEKVLELMKRKEGATLAEIAKATDWQNHSIRGFVSGHVTKKLGLKVESTKSEAGERIYRIVG